MKLWVDPDKCFGHALCLEGAPELFEWDDETRKAIGCGDVPEGMEGKAREAMRCCPEQAIVLLDSGEIQLPPPLSNDSNRG